MGGDIILGQSRQPLHIAFRKGRLPKSPHALPLCHTELK